jgi:hypothetical protein
MNTELYSQLRLNMVQAAFLDGVIKFGYGRFLLCLVLVVFVIIILSHMATFVRSKELMAV